MEFRVEVKGNTWQFAQSPEIPKQAKNKFGRTSQPYPLAVVLHPINRGKCKSRAGTGLGPSPRARAQIWAHVNKPKAR